jgi:hypothetical protein
LAKPASPDEMAQSECLAERQSPRPTCIPKLRVSMVHQAVVLFGCNAAVRLNCRSFVTSPRKISAMIALTQFLHGIRNQTFTLLPTIVLSVFCGIGVRFSDVHAADAVAGLRSTLDAWQCLLLVDLGRTHRRAMKRAVVSFYPPIPEPF